MRKLLALAAVAALAGWSGCTTSAAASGVDAGVDVLTGCQDVDGALPGTPVATFDHDLEGFILDQAGGGTVTNVAAPDAGAPSPPSLAWDGTDGNPTAGSLQLVASFSGANQYLGAFEYFGCDAIHDWHDRTLHARIKLAGGDFDPIALLYVATSETCATYDFAYGAFAHLNRSSCWQELTLDLVGPASRTGGYDPASVVDFGIQLYTGPGSVAPGTATLVVDSFSVE